MKKCAILTMDNLDDFAHYDGLLIVPMAEIGWDIDYISWKTNSGNWDDYQVVIIRSTWDYQNDTDAFLEVLSKIEKSKAQLFNSLKTVRWNFNKKYLQELDNNGVEIVPTYWLENFEFKSINDCFEMFDTNQIVIKPTISANAENTFWLKLDTCHLQEFKLEQSLKNKQLMVQPFIPSVIEEGEYSLFYFGGEYSHCILKTPKAGDFRVQEEYGSSLKAIQPSQVILATGLKALNAIPEKVLYARIDLVEFNKSFKVMEVELIEPSLYLNLDVNSAKRFVMAFDKWMK